MAKLIDELDLETQDEGLGEGLGTEPTNPTETPTNPDPDARRTSDPKRPASWKDDPEYRAYQSDKDKFKALQAAIDRTERERQEEKQRLAWYEQQLETLQTQHLDEPSKLAYENQKLKRALAALEQQRQVEEGRKRIFAKITNRFAPIGVPFEVYGNAADADEAWDLAADYALKNLPGRTAQQAQERAAKREANAVDLGGGAAVTPDDDWEAEAKRLLKKKDSVGYARHILKRKYKE